MEENLVLLAVFVFLVLLNGFTANLISRRTGARVPSMLTREGRRVIADFLKPSDPLFIALSAVTTLLMAVAAYSLYSGAYSLPMALAGLALVAAAMPVHFAARRDLAGFWKPSTRPREAQGLVETGVYARVRHPVYVSFFLLALGEALVAGNAAGAALFLLNAAALWLRARREEKELVARFGEKYLEYARRVPAFLPRIR
jgi:protein-S-isoprenylcysteine O-methyltransferase Ste14